MNNTNEQNYVESKSDKPSTLAYEYLFNYFGKDTFKGRVITGASVQLAIHVYKNGKEVKFQKEPIINDTFLCDVYSIAFDREKLYTVTKNLRADNLLRIAFGWDEINAEIVGYTLDYESKFTENELKDMPEFVKGFPVSEVMEVTEDEFRNFLSCHLDDFDIKDNIKAQVPSVSYI